jgi:hypothetical protein
VGETPRRWLRRVQARCEVEPTPALPLFTVAALAFRWAENSASVVPGSFLAATSMIGAEAAMPTGSKSVSGLKARFG